MGADDRRYDLPHSPSQGTEDRLRRSSSNFPGPPPHPSHPDHIISLSEVAVSFPSADEAWQYFKNWGVYRLHDGVAKEAADLDREISSTGHRLGENDNWIAAFCRYYREPIISLDRAFERVLACAELFTKRPIHLTAWSAMLALGHGPTPPEKSAKEILYRPIS